MLNCPLAYSFLSLCIYSARLSVRLSPPVVARQSTKESPLAQQALGICSNTTNNRRQYIQGIRLIFNSSTGCLYTYRRPSSHGQPDDHHDVRSSDPACPRNRERERGGVRIKQEGQEEWRVGEAGRQDQEDRGPLLHTLRQTTTPTARPTTILPPRPLALARAAATSRGQRRPRLSRSRSSSSSSNHAPAEASRAGSRKEHSSSSSSSKDLVMMA